MIGRSVRFDHELYYVYFVHNDGDTMIDMGAQFMKSNTGNERVYLGESYRPFHKMRRNRPPMLYSLKEATLRAECVLLDSGGFKQLRFKTWRGYANMVKDCTVIRDRSTQW